MQKIIYKYELNPYHALTELSIPIGAKVLCVQTDGKTDNPCVWALVDKDEEYLEERVVVLMLLYVRVGTSLLVNCKEAFVLLSQRAIQQVKGLQILMGLLHYLMIKIICYEKTKGVY